MKKNIQEDLTLPDEIEGKSTMVEDSIEQSPKEKELFEKQKQFEFKSKKLEPGEKKELEKQDKKEKIIDWIIIGVVFLGLIFLGYLLL